MSVVSYGGWSLPKAQTKRPRLPYRRLFSLASALSFIGRRGSLSIDQLARRMGTGDHPEYWHQDILRKALGCGCYHPDGHEGNERWARLKHIPRVADLRRIPPTTLIRDIPAAYAAIRRAQTRAA